MEHKNEAENVPTNPLLKGVEDIPVPVKPNCKFVEYFNVFKNTVIQKLKLQLKL